MYLYGDNKLNVAPSAMYLCGEGILGLDLPKLYRPARNSVEKLRQKSRGALCVR